MMPWLSFLQLAERSSERESSLRLQAIVAGIAYGNRFLSQTKSYIESGIFGVALKAAFTGASHAEEFPLEFGFFRQSPRERNLADQKL